MFLNINFKRPILWISKTFSDKSKQIVDFPLYLLETLEGKVLLNFDICSNSGMSESYWWIFAQFVHNKFDEFTSNASAENF